MAGDSADSVCWSYLASQPAVAIGLLLPGPHAGGAGSSGTVPAPASLRSRLILKGNSSGSRVAFNGMARGLLFPEDLPAICEGAYGRRCFLFLFHVVVRQSLSGDRWDSDLLPDTEKCMEA
jgi:hypothetical protein